MFGWRLTTAELASLDALLEDDGDQDPGAAGEADRPADSEVRFNLRFADPVLLRLSEARPERAGTASILELLELRERAAGAR
jgi:hypothetical protein